MKILLLGDASNCHNTLSTGLRNLGHEVIVASNGTGWMQTPRDIDISRRLPGKAGGMELYIRMLRLCTTRLKGFDVVAIHSPLFLQLQPDRVRRIFDIVKRNNRSVFLTALSTDSLYVNECLDPASPLQYTEYMHFGSPAPMAIERPHLLRDWQSNQLTGHCNYIYGNIDGAVAVLYEYYLAICRGLPQHRRAYGGIPIDMEASTPVEIPENPETIRLFLGRHAGRLTAKGTDRLEIAARRAIERHPGKAELIIVENRPIAEYRQLLASAHVVIDQAYSYSPATNARLAMANGQCAVTGAEPDYYDFIGESDNKPMFNSPVDVDAMTTMFEKIITSPPGELRRRGLKSREFVMRHNDATIVASRFARFWEERLMAKTAKHHNA